MQPIPQDIIDEIVEQLHGDKKTLMICSLVSRQFEPSCRKHLFSYIRLDPSSICRFNILLSQNPNLAALVRRLHIYILFLVLGSEMDFLRPLGMLTHLRWLELGCNSPTMNWEFLSRRVQSALLELCESPSLHTLDIGRVVGFPLALLKNTRVRKLGVQYMSNLYHTPLMQLDFTGLEALDICIAGGDIMIEHRSLDLYTGTTNSQQLSIKAYPVKQGLFLGIVQEVMEKAFKTLKHVRWQGYQKPNRNRSPHFTLATLSNLQSLTISINNIIEDNIISAIELLRDSEVSRSLEEFTLILHMRGVLQGLSVLAEAAVRSVGWDMLDAALGTLRVGVDSPLHTVHVYFISLSPVTGTRDRQLQRQLEARLPLLVAKGVRVSARFCYDGGALL